MMLWLAIAVGAIAALLWMSAPARLFAGCLAMAAFNLFAAAVCAVLYAVAWCFKCIGNLRA